MLDIFFTGEVISAIISTRKVNLFTQSVIKTKRGCSDGRKRYSVAKLYRYR